ncbi:uncharacterized protein [Palaemon carinicauda]|uniref:uncharacterized protein n=1 Tax=Palaemon carinicauda TaxID=392227 RepID=UPI0035B61A1E
MAYNPTANGIVERTHRALKASLMASCTDVDWKSRLPWVLLGLCTAPRADGEPSPAEKVYGEALTVPGKFFPTSTDDTLLDHLRDIAKKFRLCLKTYQDRTKHFNPRNLDDCGHVFVRVDAHRQPLTRLYRGPYRVITESTKAFLLDMHGQEDWVSIDRVKPAFLEGSDTASMGPGRSRVPPQNKAPGEKSNKQRREVAIHTPTADRRRAPSFKNKRSLPTPETIRRLASSALYAT